jgi:hypothetical protein
VKYAFTLPIAHAQTIESRDRWKLRRTGASSSEGEPVFPVVGVGALLRNGRLCWAELQRRFDVPIASQC